jgi:hypothetical protein
MSATCVKFSNPDLLSIRETGVNPGIRCFKIALNCMSAMSESHWRYLFHEEVKS